MRRLFLTSCLIAAPAFVMAQDQAAAPRVGISPDIAEITVSTPDGEVTISREQAEGATLDDEWAVVNRDCPPFCIQPHVAAEGTHTIGELELLQALESGEAVLVDSRTSDWFATGTIPGSINIPYTQAVERLGDLGCDPDFDGAFDCSAAKDVILFCNGLWCGQSPTAIRAMIEAGFPADRISYYRGGMQVWRLLGLTVAGGTGATPDATTATGTAAPAPAEAPAASETENPVADGTTEDAAATDEAPEDATAAETETSAQPGTGADVEVEAEAGEPATAEPEPSTTDLLEDAASTAVDEAGAAAGEALEKAQESLDQLTGTAPADAEAAAETEAPAN